MVMDLHHAVEKESSKLFVATQTVNCTYIPPGAGPSSDGSTARRTSGGAQSRCSADCARQSHRRSRSLSCAAAAEEDSALSLQVRSVESTHVWERCERRRRRRRRRKGKRPRHVCWHAPRMVATPLRVSEKCETSGLVLTESRRFESRAAGW